MNQTLANFKKNSAGFTLMESLLILSIIAIMLSVLSSNGFAKTQKHSSSHFSEQFTNDLFFAQQYALSTKNSVQIVLSPNSNSYRIRQGSFQTKDLVNREYPSSLSIDTRTMGEVITFLGNGSIDKSGAIIILQDGKERYRYVFTLGKGRFYVEER
ncbi:competence type IV pilus minor pilin ComGD [Bacillus sp. THAF10]|uniref:competence type IV pilus minor pilin ComGD n=1 Tax=Bacillus sp. THAF10 TaxID=2587848 RepID=UPI001562A96D|nr:competence type IV pilus minor pilin ComGD [Bacillus sp. THAF10]